MTEKILELVSSYLYKYMQDDECNKFQTIEFALNLNGSILTFSFIKENGLKTSTVVNLADYKNVTYNGHNLIESFLSMFSVENINDLSKIACNSQELKTIFANVKKLTI